MGSWDPGKIRASQATCKKANDHVDSSISRLANFEYRLTETWLMIL